MRLGEIAAGTPPLLSDGSHSLLTRDVLFLDAGFGHDLRAIRNGYRQTARVLSRCCESAFAPQSTSRQCDLHLRRPGRLPAKHCLGLSIGSLSYFSAWFCRAQRCRLFRRWRPRFLKSGQILGHLLSRSLAIQEKRATVRWSAFWGFQPKIKRAFLPGCQPDTKATKISYPGSGRVEMFVCSEAVRFVECKIEIAPSSTLPSAQVIHRVEQRSV